MDAHSLLTDRWFSPPSLVSRASQAPFRTGGTRKRASLLRRRSVRLGKRNLYCMGSGTHRASSFVEPRIPAHLWRREEDPFFLYHSGRKFFRTCRTATWSLEWT